VVRVRAWVNPAKQFWSELSVEATYRPTADPSRPERELDVPLPEDHPLQKRLGGVIQKLIVAYGDADALRQFQLDTQKRLRADSIAKAGPPKPDSTRSDSTSADSTKTKPDTLKAKVDSTRPKPDTLKVKPDSLKPKRDTTKVKPDTLKAKPDTTKKPIP
jgi:hypothetical protein